MTDTPAKYKRGEHPNSQAALEHKGRPTDFDTAKKRHAVYVTEEAWLALDDVAIECGCRSVSDLLEQLGRGLVKAERTTD